MFAVNTTSPLEILAEHRRRGPQTVKKNCCSHISGGRRLAPFSLPISSSCHLARVVLVPKARRFCVFKCHWLCKGRLANTTGRKKNTVVAVQTGVLIVRCHHCLVWRPALPNTAFMISAWHGTNLSLFFFFFFILALQTLLILHELHRSKYSALLCWRNKMICIITDISAPLSFLFSFIYLVALCTLCTLLFMTHH